MALGPRHSDVDVGVPLGQKHLTLKDKVLTNIAGYGSKEATFSPGWPGPRSYPHWGPICNFPSTRTKISEGYISAKHSVSILHIPHSVIRDVVLLCPLR